MRRQNEQATPTRRRKGRFSRRTLTSVIALLGASGAAKDHDVLDIGNRNEADPLDPHPRVVRFCDETLQLLAATEPETDLGADREAREGAAKLVVGHAHRLPRMLGPNAAPSGDGRGPADPGGNPP